MSLRHRRLSAGGILARLVILGFLLVVTVPVVAVILRSFGPSPGWDSSAWPRMLGSWRTWRLLAVTFAQASVSAIVTLVVGVPVAYVLARYRFRGRVPLQVLVTVPFVLPSVVVGAAFASLYGPTGLVDLRGSWPAVIAAHLCFNLAIVTRTVGAAFSAVDPDVEAAARLLGRSRIATFRSVVVPEVAPVILAAGILVFMFCLTSFGVILILGGGGVTTIEVEIWVRATRQFDLAGAAVLSAIQLIAVLATLLIQSVVSRRIRETPRRLRDTSPSPRTAGAEKVLIVASGAVVLIVSGFPLAMLLLRSLQGPGGFALDNWLHMGSVLSGTGLATSPIDATLNSLMYAALASTIAILLAVPTARHLSNSKHAAGQSLVLLPLGVSATTIGLGLLIVFGRPPIDLRSSGWLVPAAQVLVSTPLVVRSLLPSFRSVHGTMTEAAAVLGAGPRDRFLRIELPLVRTAVVAASGLGFIVCFGEFGATLFVSRSDRATMPVLIERLMSRPGGGGFGQAMALAVLMTVVCGAVLAAVDHLVARGRGGQGDGAYTPVI